MALLFGYVCPLPAPSLSLLLEHPVKFAGPIVKLRAFGWTQEPLRLVPIELTGTRDERFNADVARWTECHEIAEPGIRAGMAIANVMHLPCIRARHPASAPLAMSAGLGNAPRAQVEPMSRPQIFLVLHQSAQIEPPRAVKVAAKQHGMTRLVRAEGCGI